MILNIELNIGVLCINLFKEKDEMKRIICLFMCIVMCGHLLCFSEQRVLGYEEQKSNQIETNNFLVDYNIVASWDENYITYVTITNISEEVLYNWALMFELEDDIKEIWGANVHNHINSFVVIENAGYNSDIAPGEKVSFGFRAIAKEQISIPNDFYNPVKLMEVPIENYSIDIQKINDYEMQIGITNKSQEEIRGWDLYFNADINVNSSNCGEFSDEGDKINIKSQEYCDALKPEQTLYISLYTSSKLEKIEISNMSLYENRIINYDAYSQVEFISRYNDEYTKEIIDVDDLKTDIEDYINVKVKTDDEIRIDKDCIYTGMVAFEHNDVMIDVNISGQLNLCEDGLYGQLSGYYNELPILLTVNYAIQNKQPYVFLAVGAIDSGNDYYKVYGNRENWNDNISKKISENDNLDSNEQLEPVSVDEDEFIQNDIMMMDAGVSDYDTAARACQYAGFTYNNSTYYLGAVTLYTPIKTKSNGTYAVRAKVNSHDANAKLYAKKKFSMPGIVTYFNSNANLRIWTNSTSTDILKSSPNTTSWLTSSISLAIPFGKYLSLSVLNVTVPASVRKTLSSVYDSVWENQCNWRFNAHYDADIVNNNAYTTPKGYAGYVQLVNQRNSKHYYSMNAEGIIYYQVQTMAGNTYYDVAFNVTVKTQKLITNYPDN